MAAPAKPCVPSATPLLSASMSALWIGMLTYGEYDTFEA